MSDQSIKNYLASFPEEVQLGKAFKSAFVLNKPVSGVGGDGYWLQQTGHALYLVVFDCVGHGRLASIMTRIYVDVIKSVLDTPALLPSGALMAIHQKLHQQLGDKPRMVGSGADMAIVRIETSRRQKMHYAGAKMDLVQVASGSARRYKAGKRQVGDMFDQQRHYRDIEVDAPAASRFYLYSDGVTDLIGGPAGRKLKFSNLEKILLEVAPHPIDEQKRHIEKHLTKWSGPHLPFDDMLMIGFEV